MRVRLKLAAFAIMGLATGTARADSMNTTPDAGALARAYRAIAGDYATSPGKSQMSPSPSASMIPNNTTSIGSVYVPPGATAPKSINTNLINTTIVNIARR